MRAIRNYCDEHYEKNLPHDEILELATQKMEWKNWNVDFPMIVDKKHKLMYCEMPKVGSTNWKRVLMKLTNPIYKDVDLMGKYNSPLTLKLSEWHFYDIRFSSGYCSKFYLPSQLLYSADFGRETVWL